MQPAIDHARMAPQHREHHDEAFTDEQEQIGYASRPGEISTQTPRQREKEAAGVQAGAKIGRIGLRSPRPRFMMPALSLAARRR